MSRYGCVWLEDTLDAGCASVWSRACSGLYGPPTLDERHTHAPLGPAPSSCASMTCALLYSNAAPSRTMTLRRCRSEPLMLAACSTFRSGASIKSHNAEGHLFALTAAHWFDEDAPTEYSFGSTVEMLDPALLCGACVGRIASSHLIIRIHLQSSSGPATTRERDIRRLHRSPSAGARSQCQTCARVVSDHCRRH